MPAHRKAASGQPSTALRTGRTPSLLDRWPFRRKLNVLVIVPLAVISAMLAYVVSGEMDRARSAADTAQLVRDSAQVTKLIDAVQTEHRQALLVSLRYEAARSGRARPTRPPTWPRRRRSGPASKPSGPPTVTGCPSARPRC